MHRLRKYLMAYRLALSKALVYRTNLLLGAINVLIWFGTLILLYLSLGGAIGGYSTAELVTYILGTSLLAATLFTNVMDQMADEIVEGDLVNYLLRPINYFYYWIARGAAVRSVLLVIAFGEIVLLSLTVSDDVLLQTNPMVLLQTAVLCLGSLAMITCFDFIAAALSFWTERGFGPRWLFMICTRFLSGAALPIALMPHWAQTIFYATPFPSLIASPVESYLGHLSPSTFLLTLLTQWSWIAVSLIVLTVLWRKGTKSYVAYGS